MIAGMPIPKRMSLAKEFAVSYYRPLAVFLDRPLACAECDAAQASNLKVVLTIRFNGREGIPTTPPANINTYKTDVRKVLEKFRPAILVVENEANHHRLFYSGTANQYLDTLKAGCEVSHSLGIPCTDSGLTSYGVLSSTIEDLYVSGKKSEAMKLTQSALQGGQNIKTIEDLDQALRENAESLSFARTYLKGVRVAGADYLNFHWYLPGTYALLPVLNYLRRVSEYLPIMTNETGQHNDDPKQTERQLIMLKNLNVSPVIWFSIDTRYARSLVNRDGTFRPTGKTFKQFVRSI